MKPRVVIIGGGISGLAAGLECRTRGADVTILEAAERPGGVIGTHRLGGYLFDDGPSAIQGDAPDFRRLVDDLGLSDRVIHADAGHRERYLYHHGTLKPLPKTFGEFLHTRLFTWRQKLRAAVEPWVRVGHSSREESVAEFFGRRVGRGLTMTWVDVVVSGVYAGHPNRLGIRSAFPQLADMEREHHSIVSAMRHKTQSRKSSQGTVVASPLWTLEGGLAVAVDRLGEVLSDSLQCGVRVRKIERRKAGSVHVAVQHGDGRVEDLGFDGCILAVNAPTAGILLAPFAPDVADLLFEIESSPLVVAHVGLDRSQVPGLPVGSGFLVPRSGRLRTLGWSFPSQLFPDRAPEGKVALCGSLGGVLDPRAIDLDDDLIEHLLMGELALALGQRKLPAPEVFELVRWTDRLPQYNVGHQRRMEAVRKLIELEVPEVRLAGNWVDGITVDRCVHRGRAAATEMLQSLRTSNGHE